MLFEVFSEGHLDRFEVLELSVAAATIRVHQRVSTMLEILIQCNIPR